MRRWHDVAIEGRSVVLAGIAICIAGVILSGIAAKKRESSRMTDKGQSGNLVEGIMMCVISGALSACANLSFDYAEPIMIEALEMGTKPIWTSVAR